MWTRHFRTLQLNIFAKAKKVTKPFLPVCIGPRSNLLSKIKCRKSRGTVPLKGLYHDDHAYSLLSLWLKKSSFKLYFYVNFWPKPKSYISHKQLKKTSLYKSCLFCGGRGGGGGGGGGGGNLSVPGKDSSTMLTHSILGKYCIQYISIWGTGLHAG